jgi:phosphotransferase system IIA component
MLGLKWWNSMRKGFQVRVAEGQIIEGDLLARFDADTIARKAKGLVIVVLVANHDRFHPTIHSNILNDYERSYLC